MGRIEKRFGREVHPQPDARSLPKTSNSILRTYQNELGVIFSGRNARSSLPVFVGQDKGMEAVIDRTIISNGNGPLPDWVRNVSAYTTLERQHLR